MKYHSIEVGWQGKEPVVLIKRGGETVKIGRQLYAADDANDIVQRAVEDVEEWEALFDALRARVEAEELIDLDLGADDD